MAMKERKRSLLNEAVADWRRAVAPARESLDDATRARILDAVSRRPAAQPRPAPLASLFVPMRRLALAGTVPALALTMLLAWVLLPGTATVPNVDTDGPTLQASKVGGEVVFVIANGGKLHRVYRSSSPEADGDARLFATTDARFQDRLEGDERLVFYRID